MYVPPHAREDRPGVLADAIAKIAFGTLVTIRNGAPAVTHLPMMLVDGGERGTLLGHLSRANDQWKADSPHAIATFVGPQFYVSPSYYASKPVTQRVVPTWNYIAVEARGAVEFFDAPARLLALVRRLTDRHEAMQADPWDVGDAPADYIASQLRGIVGFELRIESLVGAWKLNRNRSDPDREGVASAIEASDDPEVRALAPYIRSGA